MSRVRVSENVPGTAAGVEFLPRRVRSIFNSPANGSVHKRKNRKTDSLPDVRWNFPPQTVSRTANANRDTMSRELLLAVEDPMIAVLIPLKEFESCR